jgi:hypothetical protein
VIIVSATLASLAVVSFAALLWDAVMGAVFRARFVRWSRKHSEIVL